MHRSQMTLYTRFPWRRWRRPLRRALRPTVALTLVVTFLTASVAPGLRGQAQAQNIIEIIEAEVDANANNQVIIPDGQLHINEEAYEEMQQQFDELEGPHCNTPNPTKNFPPPLLVRAETLSDYYLPSMWPETHPYFQVPCLEREAVAYVQAAVGEPDASPEEIRAAYPAALRSAIFALLVAAAHKAPAARTPRENAGLSWLHALVQAPRIAAAQFALDEYTSWQYNPCGYQSPAGFPSHDSGSYCEHPLLGLLTTPNPPPVREWGVKFAYAPLVATGVALAVGASASFLALTPLGLAIVAQTVPYFAAAMADSLVAFTASAAFTGIGGPAAIILLAVTTAVFEGLNVVAKEKLPDQLQAALDEAYVPPDLAALLDTEEGTQEVFGVFVEATVPSLPPVPRHLACPKADARFVHFQPGVSQHTDFILNYKDWNGNDWTACLINSQFYHVRSNGTGGHTANIIRYELPDGSQWTATLSGAGFHHYKKGTMPWQGHDDTRIDYVTWNGDSWSARLE